MAETTKNRITRMLLSKNRNAQYAKLFIVMAACVVVAVAVALHQTGVAMTHKEQVLTCPVDGVVAHTHDESCYDKDGNLVCTLPERELHVHTDDCYTETRELTCGLEESKEHKHTDECYTVTRELTCGQEEVTEEHVHGPGCFTTIEVQNDDSGEESAQEDELLLVDEDGDLTQDALVIEGNEDVFMPAQQFEDEILDDEGNLWVHVSVNAPRGAFPEGTTMHIAPLDEESVRTKVEDALKKDDEKVAGVKQMKAVDISFTDAEGNEIEPAVEVEVKLTSDTVRELANPTLVHVDKNKKKAAEVLKKVDVVNQDDADKTKGTEDTLKFESDTFSPYVIVEPSIITADVITASGDTYKITVSYGEDAGIAEGAKLKVTEITEDTEEYWDYYNQTAEAMGEEGGPSHARFFDIEIQVDGKKVEPAAPVETKISYVDGLELEAGDVVTAVHFVDQDNVELMDVDVNKKGTEFTFEQDSFSVTGIAKSTVGTGDYIIYRTGSSNSYALKWDLGRQSVTVSNGSVQSENDNVIWHFEASGSGYKISYTSGNTTKYLDIDSNGYLTTNTSKSDSAVWSYSSNKLSTQVWYYSYGWHTATYYLKYSNGSFYLNTSSSDIYLAKKSTTPHPTSSFKIHYVDENYNELAVINDSSTISTFGNNSTTPAFLIYDIDGYEYKETKLNKSTTIKPMLVRNNDNTWKYVKNSNDYETTALSSTDEVYVIYKQKTHTIGGTPAASTSQDWPTSAPQFSKSSIQNGDDTNTISLSIKAAEKQIDEVSKANVIVIFDLSNSMHESMDGKKTYDNGTVASIDSRARLSVAGAAVNTLAQSLMPSNGRKNVKMALISFSNEAKLEQDWTDSASTFTNSVNKLKANTAGGTNWEAALEMADRMANATGDEDAATVIVFVSDGDPTFRMTRGDYSDSNLDVRGNDSSTLAEYYRTYGIYGTGTTDDYLERNYIPALNVVKAISTHNKSFYSIGVSSDPEHMDDLVDDAGFGKYYPGSNKTQLVEAFANVVKSIQMELGFADVQITDGITELTHVDMKVMTNVDPNSFTYYRWGGENNKYGADYAHKKKWTTREADGCAAATYTASDGAVHWNMGEGFQLEDGVNYVVEFRAWPSQDAYDLVADLNNGVKVYDKGKSNSITDEERAQIVEKQAPTDDSQGRYELKTNTNEVYAKYKKSYRTGNTISVTGNLIAADKTEHLENLYLESMKLTIKKKFEDELTYDASQGHGEDQPESVELVLQRRDAYIQQQGKDAYIKNNGDFDNYKVKQSDGTTSAKITLNEQNNWTFTTYIAPGFILNGDDGDVMEPGYDFTITEPDIERHYELDSEIVNPMVVDGVGKYFGDSNKDKMLTAVNRVKSGIDIWKRVISPDGNEMYPDTEFTITGYILDKDGKPFTWSQSAYDNETDPIKKEALANATGAYHIFDRDGNKRVEKAHFASTGEIELKIKAGEYVRFINVPEGCTFQFTEELSGDDYELESLDAVSQYRKPNGGDYVTETNPLLTTNVGTATAALTGTGVVGNKQYVVTYTNERLTPVTQKIRFRKVAQDMNYGLEGAEFTIVIGDDTHTLKSDKNGNLYEKVNDKKQYVFELPVTSADSPYQMNETVAPDGYLKIDGPINVYVDDSGVTAKKSNTVLVFEPASDDDATGVGTILIPNSAGEKLPATGGTGTTAIYAMGIALVGIAAYGLVSKKMRNNL